MADSQNYFSKYVNSPRYKQAVMSYPEEYFTMSSDELKKAKENAKSIYKKQNQINESNKRIDDANKKVWDFLNWQYNLNNWALVWQWSVAWMPNPSIQDMTYDISRVSKNAQNNKNTKEDNIQVKENNTQKRTNNSWTNNRQNRWWVKKQQEPTYVDPNWVTHTWMTQDEFNQSMQMYEADNQWWYESQRNKTLPWWTTRWQLFDQALNKYLENPNSFDDSAKQALINVWKQLWYWWDNWQASQQSQPTVQPTVQPSTQPAQTQSQYNWFDPSQVWWRTWLWTELDRKTQWWQINIPFSL